MHFSKQSLLESNPRWLSLTLLSSATALSVTGAGLFLSLLDTSLIGPFTLLLHLVWSMALSAWVLNLKTGLAPDKRILLAVGAAIAVGSTWSSVQQWLSYMSTGQASDILLVVGAMLMDAAGGAATYVFYRFNAAKQG